MKRHRLTHAQIKNCTPPAYAGWLLRLYVLLVQAFLYTGTKIPPTLLTRLTECEHTLRAFFWFRVFDLHQTRAEPDFVSAPLSADAGEIRARLTAILSLLNNPEAEYARLLALAAVHGLAIGPQTGLAPHARSIDPHTEHLGHACARAKTAPQARPPPRSQTAIQTLAGEAIASAAKRADENRAAG